MVILYNCYSQRNKKNVKTRPCSTYTRVCHSLVALFLSFVALSQNYIHRGFRRLRPSQEDLSLFRSLKNRADVKSIRTVMLDIETLNALYVRYS